MDKQAGQINGFSQCVLRSAITMSRFTLFGGSMFFLILAPKLVHIVFGRLHQTRLVSEMTVGIVFGNWEWMKSNMDSRLPAALDALAPFTIISYFFINGLEMDPRTFFRCDKREVVISYAGTVATVAMFHIANPLLQRTKFTILDMHTWQTAWAMAFAFGSTSSPVLTRLTTELKIGKSDFGRLAVKAGLHNDMVTTSFLIFLHNYRRTIWIWLIGTTGAVESTGFPRGVFQAGSLAVGLTMQAVLLFKAVPSFMNWVDKRNHGTGKRIKESDVAMALAAIAAACFFSSLFTFSSRCTAFMMGLLLRRDGRVASQLVSRINFFLTTIGTPLYLFLICLTEQLDTWTGATTDAAGVVTQWSWRTSLAKLAIYFFISSIGKVVGTTLAALFYRFHLTEAVALGLLLNVKGMFHIFVITGSKEGLIVVGRQS